MKFFHLADLHIGKSVHDMPMLKEQRHVLLQVLSLADEREVDAVILAGDLYDRAVPSAEAVELFDDFLTGLAERNLPVLAIAGNHDSPERIAFGGRIFRDKKIYLEGTYQGKIPRVELWDDLGRVNVWLMPFLRPASVRPYAPEKEIRTYEEAVRTVLSREEIDPSERNVLVAHQLVIGSGEPERSDSESISVGGQESIPYTVFDRFDYVALGHLHGPQAAGREAVRYGGSPLKYSFSEVRQNKGLTVVELREKGKLHLTHLPLTPLHEMREIRGPIDALTSPEVVDGAPAEDYIRAVLTDDEELVDAVGRMRSVYPNLLRLDFENRRTKGGGILKQPSAESRKPPEELFAEFYEWQQNLPLDGEKRELIRRLLEEECR